MFPKKIYQNEVMHQNLICYQNLLLYKIYYQHEEFLSLVGSLERNILILNFDLMVVTSTAVLFQWTVATPLKFWSPL